MIKEKKLELQEKNIFELNTLNYAPTLYIVQNMNNDIKLDNLEVKITLENVKYSILNM